MIDRIPDSFLMESELTLEQEKFFIEQMNRFNELNKNYVNVGCPLINGMGEVCFNEGTLIHGTSRYDEEMLNNISRTGVLTGQAVGKSEDGETYYCADFHRVDRDTTISGYNSEFTYNDGRCPFGGRCDKSSAVAFVIVPNNQNRELLSYDCYRDGTLESDITKSFINTMPIDDKEKAASILYGVPASCINGIVVGGKISCNRERINKLISLFPNSYIVTSFGELIYNPSMGEKLGDDIINLRIEKVTMEYKKRQNKKSIDSNNVSVIDLIDKNIRLMSLISKNCDVSLFDNLDVLSLLKMVNEVLFSGHLEVDNSDYSVMWGVVRNYLFRKIEYRVYYSNGNDRLMLEDIINSLKKENMNDEDEINRLDNLINGLNQRYDELWNQMFRDCSDEEIVNVLIDMKWQGNINKEYVSNMRDKMLKGYGK